jgi:formylglycine-generating enzyme required for sulfatase activity
MVLDGRASDHQCRVASFREGYRLRHHGRGGTRHRAVSGRRSQPDGSRFARVPHDPGARGPGRLPELVGVRSRCPVRHPEGPGSTLHGRDRHPVVHVSFDDVLTYARWAGKHLPTEAEWEYAARGALEQRVFVWGDEFMPRGKVMANTWHGQFPWERVSVHRYERTSPVKSFPANGYGLFDMAGNVWEWTSDFFTPGHPAEVEHACACQGTRGSPHQNGVMASANQVNTSPARSRREDPTCARLTTACGIDWPRARARQ